MTSAVREQNDAVRRVMGEDRACVCECGCMRLAIVGGGRAGCGCAPRQKKVKRRMMQYEPTNFETHVTADLTLRPRAPQCWDNTSEDEAKREGAVADPALDIDLDIDMDFSFDDLFC